jgi:hypothetical protein
MTATGPAHAAASSCAPLYKEKVWSVQVRAPIRTPAQGWPFLQLPPGKYKLYERTDVHYELRVCEDFSCYFRLADLEALVVAGDLIVDGSWPQ